jgi:hypothetical protein
MEEPAASRWSTFALAGMLVGTVLAVGGWIWSAKARPTDVWSHEQAAQLEAANNALHAARSSATGDDTARLAAAQQRADELNRQLEHAREVRDSWGRRAAAVGLGLTIASGLGYLATRRS